MLAVLLSLQSMGIYLLHHHRKKSGRRIVRPNSALPIPHKSISNVAYSDQSRVSLIRQFILDFLTSFVIIAKYYFTYLILILAISTLILGGFFWLYTLVFKDLPTPQDLTKKQQSVTTKILDRHGEVLYKIYEDENRTILSLSEIPKQIQFATIAIEDKDFYNHHGFSIRGIVRAIVANAKEERLQGGSTLTQQLVKNRLLTTDRTFSRKIKELLLSVLVENIFTKEQILEMYLNQVSYGGSAYGIEEASQRYFGKSARELSLAESALLAGLPAAPSAYTPFGSNPEYAKQRQEEVLRRMSEDGYISQEQAHEAYTEELIFSENKVDIKAPHFVMYIRRLLAQQFGEDIVSKGGLEVRTTLDYQLQKQVEEIVSKEVASLSRLRVKNGAALVTNPQTGEILAMVGSSDYFDFSNDGQVNVTIRPRQPGSSIKPITYALALEKGKTTQTIIEDAPITYVAKGSPPYSPKNYDGKYHGKVTLKEALASSYNIPAVKTLNELGITPMIDLAEAMGITTWQERNRFGLSLTLGGGEVTMFDMAEVYGTFANEGKHTDLNPIIEITDYTGKSYYNQPCLTENQACTYQQVIKPETAYLISNILSDNVARTPAFGPLSTLNIPNQEVAVKTGTTNNLRDNWTIGYISDRVVTVWVGNNDNTPMSYVASGITGASPIWNKIMRLQLDEKNVHKFAKPATIVKVRVCKASKFLPCKFCPQISTEYFVVGTDTGFNCDTISPNTTLSPEIKDKINTQVLQNN